MSTAKWSTPSAVSGNLATAGQIDSLANGAASTTLIPYDNTTGLDLYLNLALQLASITSTAGASVTLVNLPGQGNLVPDNTAGLGGGDRYVQPLTVGASAKVTIFPMVRIYPGKNYLALVNGSGTALATGNILTVQSYDEASN